MEHLSMNCLIELILPQSSATLLMLSAAKMFVSSLSATTTIMFDRDSLGYSRLSQSVLAAYSEPRGSQSLTCN